MGFMRVAWAALLILSAMGCAVTPQTKQSLSSYTLAMAQVEQSADMFLTDFSNGLKVQAELSSLGGTVDRHGRGTRTTDGADIARTRLSPQRWASR